MRLCSIAAAFLCLFMTTFAVGQCQAQFATAPGSKVFTAPSTTLAIPPAARQSELRETAEETQFLATGPRLYPMDKALQLSKATGKPVICWMGKHLFSDPRARELSGNSILTENTIQAVMDGDGTPYDAIGPRLKFTNGNYGPDSKTFYVKLADFDKAGKAEAILAATRGGGR